MPQDILQRTSILHRRLSPVTQLVVVLALVLFVGLGIVTWLGIGSNSGDRTGQAPVPVAFFVSLLAVEREVSENDPNPFSPEARA